MPRDELGRRPRRYVPHVLIAFARMLGFRYDYVRRGYIMPIVGHRRGPVLRDRRQLRA